MSIENDILQFLKKGKTRVFCFKDLSDFGTYKSVAKAVERLTIKGYVRRVTQGIYYYPLINETFHVEYPPEMEAIAEALSRNNNWQIRETGSFALYKLGMNNQIPMKAVYLSSGPYRIYQIGMRTIEFKSSSRKNFAFSRKTSLVIQAMKTIGNGKIITEQDLMKISSFLSNEEKEKLCKEIFYAPAWMHTYIKRIGEL
ncbi:MAG: DUF6088 family protein [Candidatus Enterosoma sp.]|nr:DUF6088 family protein [Bacilli bacterium]MDD7181581.1 DUF6088 family protein [Bacilli bacterium]MDY3046636.1 DUF6088 family protein [Candidatus Enterosoma sp.]